MSMIDETHDPALTSWVESANGHSDFPIQNLPLGVFSAGNREHRIGVGFGLPKQPRRINSRMIAPSTQTPR